MKQATEKAKPAGRAVARRAAVVLLVAAVAVVLLVNREAVQRLEWLQGWGAGPKTAALVIAVMAVLLACGLTASVFLILTPLLFPPHWSALVTTCGFTLGAAGAYAAARYVGGAWAGRFSRGRVHGFLTRHSSFLALLGLRLAPASPHSLVSYAAGFTRLSFARFILATLAGAGLKSYVYALAVRDTVRAAGDESDAVGPSTVLLLLGVALLALVGHVLSRRYAAAAHAATPEGAAEAGLAGAEGGPPARC